jgi:hypothetical protein
MFTKWLACAHNFQQIPFRLRVCPQIVQTSMPQQAISTEDAKEREITTGKQAAGM